MKPAPLTPPDLDLRSFGYMPLEVVRLRDSDLVVLASGEEFRAAVLLWCAAWHQVPAGSVPKDERMLANLAGFGRDIKGWRSVSETALRGFIECNDGRLYHPVIADIAITSGTKKRKQGNQTAAATEARRIAKEKRDAERGEERNEERNDTRNDAGDADVSSPNDELEFQRNDHQGIGTDGNGRDLNRTDSKNRDLFLGFWEAYPRRDEAEQQERAETEFAKLVASGVDPAVITFGAKAYCAKIRKQNNYATKFVKVAWRWLGEQDFSGAAPVLVHSDAPSEPTETDWRAIVRRFIVNESSWPRSAGNAPGSRSCRCPAGILAEEGICPNTGLRLDETWWFAEEETPELRANLSHAADHRLNIRLYDITVDGVTKQNGAFFIKRIPPGYDEATGEKLSPTNAEDAA